MKPPFFDTMCVSEKGFIFMRKRLTERMPWLLPLRQKQRNFFFYMKMRFDGRDYAVKSSEQRLKNVLFEDRSLLINEESGMDIQYQYNKVHNLKLAASTINGIVIQPNQTFSFWKCVRQAKKKGKYKEGLSLVNGELVHVYGGGLCQISNLLFWCFVHSPLTIVERHTHFVKAFPNPPSDIPEGMDATVSEGWKDLKVRNDTDTPIQIVLDFDDRYLIARLLQDAPIQTRMSITGKNLRFIETKDGIVEEIEIWRTIEDQDGQREERLYQNRCRIGYPLSEEVVIKKEEER